MHGVSIADLRELEMESIESDLEVSNLFPHSTTVE